MGSVTLRNIRKSFGPVEVLHGIDVDIDDGEFVVLVGPSGCGKSTLLRSIAGLETISEGDIFIDGKSVIDLPPKKRNIAMVFQNYALYPHMTVEQNMGFSLRLAGTDRKTKRHKVREAAAILGLEDLLQRYPRQLSGGQRQRVAMGRAIVRNPSVFLFDEPLSNLDAKLRVEMRTEIKELHQRLGTTVIYVTHDQIEAMTMAEKIVVMKDGYVEQIGDPLKVYDHPSNTFVAGFIGSPAMNLVSAHLEPSGEIVAGGAIHFQSSVTDRKGDVILGIRPEDVVVNASREDARVVVVEPTGAETQIVADIGHHLIVASVRQRLKFSPGDKIGLSAAPEKVHVFDAADGQTMRTT